MNWYIVQAYSGFEKGSGLYQGRTKKHKLSDNLQEILVPTHEVEVKKEKELKEKSFFRICFSQNH